MLKIVGGSPISFVLLANTIQNTRIVHARGVKTLCHLDGKSLWKSVVADTNKAVSRGKRTKKRKIIDLGRSKVLGEGKLGYLWPGLNAPALSKVTQRSEEEQLAYLEKKKEREEMRASSRKKPVSYERGWTGGQWGGQLVIPSNKEEEVEGFSCRMFEARRVSHMAPKVGRMYQIRAIVAVGNGKGVYGLGMRTSSDVTSAARMARIKALNSLQYVERFENRTVFEDMYVNHHRTYMSIRQQPKDYGLRCHRAIITLSQLIGIKDLYVRTYGATTMLNLLKCFVKALRSSETHQQKADRLGYHVVACDQLKDNFPVVLASPSDGVVKSDPYDEYDEYLNKPLITREVRKREGYFNHPWSNILYGKSQGPPVPSCNHIPEVIRNIREAVIE